jgi:hypothetical protein
MSLQATPRVATTLRWIAYLVTAWLLLRPALLITVALDDYINPFDLFDRYGPSLSGYLTTMLADVPKTGHFNYVGMAFGGVVYWLWAQLIGAGVRYSLIYAITKFVVIVVAALVAARVLRRLLGIVGLPISTWGARAGVGLTLFATIQLHVPWSLDPVGSFPLSGYLAAAVGLLALDLGIAALAASTAPAFEWRRSIIGAFALCVAVLYYELNIVMVVALLPVVLVMWGLSLNTPTPYLRRTTLVLVVPVMVMTIVLQQHAASLNTGYTGTQMQAGGGSVRAVGVAILGSIPGAAWSTARDWLRQPITYIALSYAAIAATAVFIVLWTRRPTLWKREPTQVGGLAVVLAAAVPLAIWWGSAVVQGFTTKVSAEAVRVGYVYNYYAYGSLAIAMLAVLVVVRLASTARLRRIRVVVALAAIAFTAFQVPLNDTLQRVYDERLAPSSAVLVAFSEEWPAEERCAAIDDWLVLPWWQQYYREAMVDGTNALYEHEHGEPFCASATP